MRTVRTVWVTTVLTVLPIGLLAQTPTDSVAAVDELFAEWHAATAPGCAVGVARAGRTLVSRAYGIADLEHGIPNTPETIFEAGSVAKQFTAAAIVLLALDGMLSLDDYVRRYVPELPDDGSPITIRHLLNHTSGLRDWGSIAAISGWGRGVRTHNHAHVLDILSRQSALNYPPGEQYSYTNSGYNLLAIIVDRVSGQSFADFSRERIFEPLGLTSTQWRDDYRRIVPGRSSAYSRVENGFAIDRPIEHVHGNGGLLTTVGDLLRWTEHLRTGRLLGGERFVDLMHERGRLTDGSEITYASGVRVTDHHGVPVVDHTGSTAGYRAYLAHFPEQDLSVALLCNVSAVNPGALGGQVANLFLGDAVLRRQPLRPPAGLRVPARRLEARAGIYRDARTGEPLRLAVVEGRLRIARGGALIPLSPTVFQLPGGDRHFVFEPVPGGRRERIRVVLGEADTPEVEIAAYEPVEAFRPVSAQLAEYAGEYRSEDAETTFSVEVEEGELVIRRRPDHRVVLTPVYPDAFEGYGLVRFHRDTEGRITELGLRQDRVHDLRFQRLQD